MRVGDGADSAPEDCDLVSAPDDHPQEGEQVTREQQSRQAISLDNDTVDKASEPRCSSTRRGAVVARAYRRNYANAG